MSTKSMTWREPPRIRKEDVLHIVRCAAETMQSSNARFLRNHAKTLNGGVTPMQALNEAADALDPQASEQSRGTARSAPARRPPQPHTYPLPS